MKLQDGRPTDLTGKLPKEIRVYDFLDTLNISYQRVDHEAAMTMEAREEIDQVLGDNTSICKNLFYVTDKQLIFICFLCRETNLLKPKNYRHKLEVPDYHLPNLNLWNNIWTSLPAPSVLWD